jgi:pantoate--beta-alanine ligase
MMEVLNTIQEFRAWRKSLPVGESPGFVPTMGALHKGHASLIAQCCRENAYGVVSIFINPIQFNSSTDLSNYPKSLDSDLEMCEKLGVKAIFSPSKEVMYRPGHVTYCQVAELDKTLCGATRPGHFQGVCTVVLKLFHIVLPGIAYFGQKDYQQARILQQLVSDLDMEIQIEILPIVREPSGLAMSSRNLRLSPQQRQQAAAIYSGLTKAQALFQGGQWDSKSLIKTVETEILKSNPEKIDYITVASRKSLQPLSRVEEPAVLATAVYYGEIRLIDNVLLNSLTNTK